MSKRLDFWLVEGTVVTWLLQLLWGIPFVSALIYGFLGIVERAIQPF